MKEFYSTEEFKEALRYYIFFLKDQILICTKNMLTASEAAQYLGVSEQVLRAWVKKYDIPHYMPESRKVYFKREELERWLTKNKVGGNSI